MVSAKSTAFLLVPGSFSTTALYDKVIAQLRSSDHDVRTVELLSANDGSRMPPATMEDDAANIRQAVISILEEGKDVVMAFQSYGGVPGSEALKGLGRKDRSANQSAVIGVLYVGSFVPNIGQSLRDVFGEENPEPYKTGIPGEYFPAIVEDFAPFIFNDVPDQEEVKRYFGTMVRHSSDSFGGKVTHAASNDIPGTQIIPEKDLILPVERQEMMHKEAVARGARLKRVFVEGAGHAVNVSRPEVIVEELLALAKQQE